MAPESSSGNGHEINHVDIYLRLGELSGSITALTNLVQDKRADIVGLSVRLNEVETKVAGGVALAIAMSILLPVAISLLAWLNPADPQGKSAQLAKQKEEIHQLQRLLRSHAEDMREGKQ